MIRTPRVITITPLRLAYATIGCILIWVTAFHFPSENLQTASTNGAITLVPVTFTLNQMEAQSVSLMGSFNDWRPQKNVMKFDASKNMWVLQIEIPAGVHEYVFLIDNERVLADPDAEFFKSDGFGSRNSIIVADTNDENFL